MITIYKPPKGNIKLFTESVSQLISSIRIGRSEEVFVCGDFNIDLLEHINNADTQHFLAILQSLSLLPVISKPTRITNTTATLLDHIYVTSPYKILPGIIVDNTSDHMPTFLIRADLFNSFHNSLNNRVTYRKINEESLMHLYNYLNSCNLMTIAEDNDSVAGLTELLNILQTEYNRFCPINSKIISYKSLHKPWITPNIISNLKKKRSYYILHQQNKISKELFTRFRNFVTSQIRDSKKQFFKHKFDKYKKDSKNTWRVINSLLRPRGDLSSNCVKELVVGGETVSTDKDISESFNSFFCKHW